MAVLQAAVESGVTFFDTADVYGDGRSERVIGRSWPATPGRASRSRPRWAAGSSRPESTTRWRTSAPGRTGPGSTWAPTGSTWSSCTARRPRFSPRTPFRRARHAGRRGADRGVRGERRNLRRGTGGDRAPRRGQRADHPERVPAQAARSGAAGRGRGRSRHHRPGAARVRLLSGRYTRDTTFAADDHRSYNAHGEAFDVGETFSGVGLEAGVDASAEFAAITGALPGPGPRLGGPRLNGHCGG